MGSSVSEWLQAHPAVSRLVQLLLWAANHPILGVVIFILVVALAFSLIKALGRLMEILGLSILKAPFKMLQVLLGVSFQSAGKFGGLAVKHLPVAKNAEQPALQNASPQPTQKDKQQRLAEISSRLEAIGLEQNELLQEVAAILASEE